MLKRLPSIKIIAVWIYYFLSSFW